MLLMVIIVALCFGIGRGFNTLNGYLNRYIGDYTACLMEYGELPSLGIKDASLDRHTGGTGKTCNEKYAPFSFADGRPSSGGSGGSGGTNSNGSNSNSANSGNGKNGSNSNKNSSNAGKKGSANGSDSDSDGKDGSGELGDGGSSKSPYKSGQIARAGTAFGTIDGSSADAQRVKIIEVDEEENSSRKRKNKNYSMIRNDYDRSGYRAVTGKMQEEYQKTIKNKINRAPSTSVTVMNAGGSGLMPFKKQLPQRAFEFKKTVDEDNSKFSFGSFLRWVLIAGMVVAIVIFFGGQILNYSNSQD